MFNSNLPGTNRKRELKNSEKPFVPQKKRPIIPKQPASTALDELFASPKWNCFSQLIDDATKTLVKDTIAEEEKT
jgi:spore germination protein GerM